MAFLRSLKTWPTFGKGWQRRVADVRNAALGMAAERVNQTPKTEHVALDVLTPKPVVTIPAPNPAAKGFWASLVTALMGILKGR
jgi:lysozyme family protein